MFLLAGSIAATLISSLYVSAQRAMGSAPVAVVWSGPEAEAATTATAEPVVSAAPSQELPSGLNLEDVEQDVTEMSLEMALSSLEMRSNLVLSEEMALPNSEDIVMEGGFRIGALTVERPTTDASDPSSEVERSASRDTSAESSESDEAQRTTPTRRTRRRPAPPPPPRLHPNPGMHTVMVARRMMAQNERIQGSCYRYLSEVFERAGHDGWRRRTIVYRAEREGPYANLDLIRPGDWLYIVTDPGSSPPATHSVMFVGSQDRALGYARTISHPGWGAPHPGRESGYDVSRTYRIIRPTLPQ